MLAKRSSNADWGYTEDPDLPKLLIPNDDLLDVLDHAVSLVGKYSYRATANWVTKETGVTLTYQTLENIVRRRKFKVKQEAAIKGWQRKFKEAADLEASIKEKGWEAYKQERIKEQEAQDRDDVAREAWWDREGSSNSKG